MESLPAPVLFRIISMLQTPSQALGLVTCCKTLYRMLSEREEMRYLANIMLREAFPTGEFLDERPQGLERARRFKRSVLSLRTSGGALDSVAPLSHIVVALNGSVVVRFGRALNLPPSMRVVDLAVEENRTFTLRTPRDRIEPYSREPPVLFEVFLCDVNDWQWRHVLLIRNRQWRFPAEGLSAQTLMRELA